MKTTARVVVIGGGVVGCSVLYHLTKLGWTDVMLVERSELTSGSTWHAAGGFHTLNADTNMAALQGYTIRLYRELEELTGMSCGLHHVGGVTLEAVMPLMNAFGRIPLCGMISQYNATEAAPGPDRSGAMWRSFLVNRLSVRGFIVTDHWGQYPDFLAEVAPLVMTGKIKAKETVMEGLDKAPAAFMSLLSGGNFGKMVVKVGDE